MAGTFTHPPDLPFSSSEDCLHVGYLYWNHNTKQAIETSLAQAHQHGKKPRTVWNDASCMVACRTLWDDASCTVMLMAVITTEQAPKFRHHLGPLLPCQGLLLL
jgi:hypothetical protein